MPFTPSHAVVALPFVRTPLVPAAIAVGAMTPDLPLFVRGTPFHYGISHDLVWLPATLIVAFGLLVLWRCVLRPAVRELTPRTVSERLPPQWDRGAAEGWRETVTGAAWWAVPASLTLGVVTHVVWDLFTHEGRWGVEALPALQQQWGPLLGVKWLQHGSSAIGLVILTVWGIRRLAQRDPVPRAFEILGGRVRLAWWASLPFVLTVAWGWGLAAMGPLDESFTIAHLAYRVLPPACAVWGAATMVLCVAVQLRRRSARRDTPGLRG